MPKIKVSRIEEKVPEQKPHRSGPKLGEAGKLRRFLNEKRFCIGGNTVDHETAVMTDGVRERGHVSRTQTTRL